MPITTPEEIIGGTIISMANELAAARKAYADLEHQVFCLQSQVEHVDVCGRCKRGPKILPWKDEDHGKVCVTCANELGKEEGREAAKKFKHAQVKIGTELVDAQIISQDARHITVDNPFQGGKDMMICGTLMTNHTVELAFTLRNDGRWLLKGCPSTHVIQLVEGES